MLFKRVKKEEIRSINLRLVGFPGAVELTHPQLLTITTSSGKVFQAAERFATKSPAPNVGEYDLKELLPNLSVKQSITLTFLSNQQQIVSLKIPPPIILEWQKIASY